MESVRLDGLIDVLPDAVVVIDGGGVLRGANATSETQYGWQRDHWMGRSILELIHPDDLEWTLSSLATVTDKEVGTPIEVRVRAAEEWRLVEVIGRPLEHDGETVIVLSVRDLTQRRLWEVAGDDTAMFRSILQNAASLTFLTDPDGTIRAVSAALIRLTGYGPDDVIGTNVSDLIAPPERPRAVRAIQSMVEHDSRGTRLETSLTAVDRDPVPVQLAVVNLIDDPTVQGLVITGHDISELCAAREELEHIAQHDPLTGLPNRSQLTRFLERRLDPGDPGAGSVVAAFIDLDRFKPVNDLYGHESGDELLTGVASRLRDVVRGEDLVARLGGDEFVVVTGGTEASDAAGLVRRLEKVFGHAFPLSIGAVRVSASIGVAEAQPGDDVDTVLAEADSAMYAMKTNGRAPAPRGRTVATRRQLAERVTEALETGEIVWHYQPIVDLATEGWVGLEALARWNHPERGLLLPADFLDIVEDIGLCSRLGETMVQSVCADMRRLQAATGAIPHIAVNASADEITDPGYPAMIERALRHGAIDPNRLTVEISERSILERSGRSGKAAPANLTALAETGVGIAVDDFGTGYSSLTHLVAFPIDRIKIDRSFVAGAVDDTLRRSVIAALVGLADNTEMSLIAEGIDHPDQIELLRELGCFLGQGFHYARPMAYERLEAAFRYRRTGAVEVVAAG